MQTGENNVFDQRVAAINDRLRSLDAERASLLVELAKLTDRGVQPSTSEQIFATSAPFTHSLSNADKLALFRRLFHGRQDIYAVCWENKKSGQSGYKPACRYDYRRIDPETGKPQRIFLPLDDTVIVNHLRGIDPAAQVTFRVLAI